MNVIDLVWQRQTWQKHNNTKSEEGLRLHKKVIMVWIKKTVFTPNNADP